MMRCLLLRRDANSNAKGMDKGEIFKWGNAFPLLEALGRVGAGQRLAPSGEHLPKLA